MMMIIEFVFVCDEKKDETKRGERDQIDVVVVVSE